VSGNTDRGHAQDCLQAVVNVGPGYWVVVLLSAVMTGFDGALSTVSTLVNEVTQLPIPDIQVIRHQLLQACSTSYQRILLAALQLAELLHTVLMSASLACNALHAIRFLGQSRFCAAANRVLLLAQISTMSAELPDRLHALWYPVASIVSALLLGIAIYGGPAWARM